MNNCPYCNKEFKSWKSVRGHTSSCTKNSKEFYIHAEVGPIHYTEFYNLSSKEFKNKYPGLDHNDKNNARKNFRKNGLASFTKIWNKDTAIDSIKDFYKKYNRNPTTRDVKNCNIPSFEWAKKNFGSWNSLLAASGLRPNNCGFGTNIVSMDGTTCRSSLEARFIDKFLYGLYEYEYEKKYPGINRFSDFYIPEKQLYIEVAGGLRPEVIKEKIEYCINNELKLLVVYPKDLDKDSLNNIISNKSYL